MTIFWLEHDDDDFEIYEEAFRENNFDGEILHCQNYSNAVETLEALLNADRPPSLIITNDLVSDSTDKEKWIELINSRTSQLGIPTVVLTCFIPIDSNGDYKNVVIYEKPFIYDEVSTLTSRILSLVKERQPNATYSGN